MSEEITEQIEISIDVFCEKCGADLTVRVEESTFRKITSLHVDPCEYCIDKAKDEAAEKAYERGIDDGRAEAGD